MIDVHSQAFQLEVKKELARRDFWEYCKFTSPDFYKEERAFLKDLSQRLQWFVEESDAQMMVVNMPPRHGKSRTATKFVQWVFGRFGIGTKVMTGSYNETLSGTFAKQVRDCIAEQPTLGITVYNDLFEKIKIKYGEASASKWALEGSSQANYLATSPSGTATGFGCNLMILDDTIKSAEEAYNANTLQKIIDWFDNTMISRTENNFKIIIIMTRWCSNDLAGYVLKNYDNVVHITYKAVNPDGTMLCEEILSKKDYKVKTKNMNKDIVEANYNQSPIDIKGRLYSSFKTYTEIPKDSAGNPLFEYILNYTDTADEGSDFLCSICYGMFQGAYYILDIYYTKDSMEITEPATAAMLKRNNVGCAIIESNNGGKGFARNVEREGKEHGNNHTTITWFHQSKNKVARILSNSTSVMNNLYFPINWVDRFPEFAHDITAYQKEGKNAHDDCADALTGVYENPKPRGKATLNKKLKGGFRKMYRLPKDTEISLELLQEFLELHAKEVESRFQKLKDAYTSEHEILKEPKKPAYKPDNRIVVNFPKYAVDTMNGFFVGNPIKTTAEEEAVEKYVEHLEQYNDQDDNNAELSKICSIYGHGFEMYYADENTELCITYLSPLEAFMIYDDSIIERPLYFVRRYTDKDGNEFGSISSKKGVRHFKVDGEVSWADQDWEAHYFNDVPATEYVENAERQGIFEPVLSIVNAYNKAISEKANDVDYFADAYLKILGVELEEGDLRYIRDNRVINLFDSENLKDIIVEFMDKPNNDTSQENLLDRLERLIFQISMVANISDENFGTSSGTALKYKLQAMSNLEKTKERKFASGMNRRYKLLFGNPISKVPADAWMQLKYKFTPNIPANLLEESQIAGNIEGIVSHKTQLRALSIVENVQEELDAIAEENEDVEAIGRKMFDFVSKQEQANEQTV